MNVKLAAAGFVLWSTSAWAQGFAGLGQTSEGFSDPTPGYSFVFPDDHAAHPEYRIEWWYLTANLADEHGTPYGLQWTLFRSALAPRATDSWDSPQIWMAHAAVTTPDGHYVTERFARDGVGQAGVTATPFEAWIDEWHLRGSSFDTMEMRAGGPEFSFDMSLVASGPLVFHGDEGFSVKSGEGQASYYYSQPFFDISGTLETPEGRIAVTGNAWLDREWSSAPLSENQTGWDWFSLSFEDGTKLMGFQVREGADAGYTYASWIEPDGALTPYANGAFRAEPLRTSDVGGRDVPTEWRVVLTEQGIDVTVTALNNDAWMDVSVPYWEGPVRVSGSHDGVGYLEMTGYE